MAPRRPHNKSRNGCDTCKQRRVKCDERGPPCQRCLTRGAQCRYSTRATGDSPQSPAIPSGLESTHAHTPPHSPSLVPSPDQSSKSPVRLLELELLHRYSTKTYKGFALLSSDEELWQSFAVKEALKFEFLMKEIFALAALHKATEIPESASEYINYALEWKNEALALAHNALQNINQGNSGAVFMFSIMTMIFAIVPPLSVPGITFRSPLENLLVLFEFQKGTASLAGICRHWLETSPFGWIFGLKPPENTVRVNENFDIAITRLKELNASYTENPPTDSVVYSNAINSLSFCSVGSRGRVLAWLTMAGQDFLSKLKEEEPMALLILIHWAVLLESLNDLWWAKNAGKRLVEDVVVVLEKVAFSSGARRLPGWAEAVGWARWEAGVRAGG
ncbi:hypothetical protein BKA61DRAFT_603392 [Leptodontidium sp. MPI-SDFR-AT-0119]|nr:hypothetical protein BKA61DRAFT_603392 [Leptodontidium sp. MPI-SDFR-AT-0119]